MHKLLSKPSAKKGTNPLSEAAKKNSARKLWASFGFTETDGPGVLRLSEEEEAEQKAKAAESSKSARKKFEKKHGKKNARTKSHALKTKRNIYSDKQKAEVVALALKLLEDGLEVDGELLVCLKVSDCVKVIKTYQGYEKVNQPMLTRWAVQAQMKIDGVPFEPKKRGSPVNEAFEAAVINKLIILKLTERDEEGKVKDIEVIANAAFSYELFKVAAEEVRKRPEFVNDELLKELKFSNGWVYRLKERYLLKRRRTSTKLKKKPSPAEVVAHMKALQKRILDNKITADIIFNEDETAVDSVAALLFQFVPTSADRATDTASGNEDRFTTLLGSSGTGRMLPSMIVLKCATQSKVRNTETTVHCDIH
jgi:hypothetical protein